MFSTSHALSSEEIMSEFPDIQVITYRQLSAYKTIEELLKKFNKVIILYFNDEGFGHWVGLFMNSQGINFFDSYGSMPDVDQVANVDPKISKKYGQMNPLLVEMLLESKYPVRYNDVQYQSYGTRDGKRINTCGYHCCVRLQNSEMKENEYFNYIVGNMLANDMSSDEVVVEIFKVLSGHSS